MSAPQWDGIPPDPRTDAWWWLIFPDGTRVACHWSVRGGGWEASDTCLAKTDYQPSEAAEDHVGCEPCHTPAEVAALVDAARREEREACARAADQVATRYHIMMQEPGIIDAIRRDILHQRNGARDALTAIRARGEGPSE